MSALRGILFLAVVTGLSVAWAFDSLYESNAFRGAFNTQSECIAHISAHLQRRDQTLLKRYRSLEPHGPGIKPLNESRLLVGQSDTAVLMVHGFAASPFEVEEVAVSLRYTHGLTVFSPLLEGFGSTATMANRHQFQDWQRGLADDIQLLSLCYKKVILAGFSLGGALVTDFMLTAKEHDASILGVITLSPFYDTSSAFYDFLRNVLGTFSETYSHSWMYSISNNPDLLMVVQYPEYYLEDFPVKAAKEVVLLGKEIQAKASKTSVSLPFFLSYSEADTIINQDVARQLYSFNLTGKKDFLIFPKDLKIPHQITRPEVNPHLKSLMERIDLFLQPLLH